MAKSSRSALFGAVAGFREEDGAFFLPDNIKVAFSPSLGRLKSRFVCAAPVVDVDGISDTVQLGLGESAPVEIRNSNRGREICWRIEGANFQQSLGRFGRRKNVTLVADWNPIRSVRAALPVAQERAHNPHVDNYLDRRVVGLVEGQRACFAALDAVIARWRADYCRVLAALWGERIEPAEVHVSLNMIELAWDALTPDTASLGTRLFLHEWNRSIADAKHAFIVERLEHDADGALRGIGARGEILKLYRKTEDFLRFEAQLSRKKALKILKASCEKTDKPVGLDLDDVPDFLSKLATIAGSIYTTIMGVQRSVVLPPPSGLPLMFAKMARKPFERDVVDGLLNNGAVRCSNQNMYRFLRDLQRDGLVQIGPGKGFWSATPVFAEELRLLRRARENQAKWLAS